MPALCWKRVPMRFSSPKQGNARTLRQHEIAAGLNERKVCAAGLPCSRKTRIFMHLFDDNQRAAYYCPGFVRGDRKKTRQRGCASLLSNSLVLVQVPLELRGRS